MTGNVLTVVLGLKIRTEHDGFKTSLSGASERETPVRWVDGAKAGRQWRTPRIRISSRTIRISEADLLAYLDASANVAARAAASARINEAAQ